MKKSTIVLIVVLAVIVVIAGYLIYCKAHLGVECLLNCPNAYFNKTLQQCVCGESPLVGGCAGVQNIYWGECCDNWANENGISRIQCVGNWTVEDNQCVWKCQSD